MRCCGCGVAAVVVEVAVAVACSVQLVMCCTNACGAVTSCVLAGWLGLMQRGEVDSGPQCDTETGCGWAASNARDARAMYSGRSTLTSLLLPEIGSLGC